MREARGGVRADTIMDRIMSGAAWAETREFSMWEKPGPESG